MDKVLQFLLKEFKVKSEEELVKAKSNLENTQLRVFKVKKPSLVKLSEGDCKRLCTKVGVDYVKGYEKRVIEYRNTDETVDRYGDIVRAKGCQLQNYKKNAVVPYSHMYHLPPIGNAIKTWIDAVQKTVNSYCLFIDNTIDDTGFSETIFKMVLSGFMKANSVGFVPIEVYYPESKEEYEELGLGRWGVVYNKWDMLEFSPCTVPANPNATTNSFTEALKGIDKKSVTFEQKDLDILASKKVFEDVNFLDQFVESVKGMTAGIDLILPNIDFNLSSGDNMKKLDLENIEEVEKVLDCVDAKVLGEGEEVKTVTGKRVFEEKSYIINFLQVEGSDAWKEESYTYCSDVWTEEDAKKHCEEFEGIKLVYIKIEESVIPLPTPATPLKEVAPVEVKVDFGSLLDTIKTLTDKLESFKKKFEETNKKLDEIHKKVSVAVPSSVPAKGKKSMYETSELNMDSPKLD